MSWRTDKSIDKSIDKLIDKSIDTAAARNLPDHHADRAREGATPGGCRTGAGARGPGRSTGGSLPPSPALEESGSSRAARDTKCRTGRNLRAPIRRRQTNGTPLGTPLGARHRAGGVASRSALLSIGGHGTSSMPPNSGYEWGKRSSANLIGDVLGGSDGDGAMGATAWSRSTHHR
jgi:hypothetical protein